MHSHSRDFEQWFSWHTADRRFLFTVLSAVRNCWRGRGQQQQKMWGKSDKMTDLLYRPTLISVDGWCWMCRRFVRKAAAKRVAGEKKPINFYRWMSCWLLCSSLCLNTRLLYGYCTYSFYRLYYGARERDNTLHAVTRVDIQYGLLQLLLAGFSSHDDDDDDNKRVLFLLPLF